MLSPAQEIDVALADQFRALAAQWKAETALLSSTAAMVAHPAYRAIVALGPPVVPLLLQDLQREPAHWFEALQAITGADPVPPEEWGRIPAMAARWLAWGRSRGLIERPECMAAAGTRPDDPAPLPRESLDWRPSRQFSGYGSMAR